MSSIEKRVTGRYSSLEDQSFEVQDLGHESDSTAYSEGFLSKAGAIVGERRISRAKRVQEALTWVRWGTVVSLQLLIVILLFIKMPNGSDEMGGAEFGEVEMGGDINGIYKSTSHKITPFTPEPGLYMPNMSNADERHRLEIQANWDKLMPKGSGNLVIKDWTNHPLLGPPVKDDPTRTGDLYQTTWTHALHCLYHNVDNFHRLLLIANNATASKNTSFIDPHHASHCFEYLRNNILCSADMTLEGGSSHVGHEGLGNNHVCRNREDAVRWIEERRVDDLQSIAE